MDILRTRFGVSGRTTLVHFIIAATLALMACGESGSGPSSSAGARPSSMPAEVANKLAARAARRAAGIERFTAADEAQAFFAMKRAPIGESAVPVERYLAARQQMERMPQYSSASGRELPSREDARRQPGGLGFATPWTPLGPGNIGGRTRAVVIDPTSPNTMYIAGVAGGIWKTVDAGASWTPLDDLMPNLAVGSLAMDPSNPNVIYAGTGEGYFNADGVRGAGIFKSANAGVTWSHLASTTTADFHYVNKLIVSHLNPLHLYAATRTGVWRTLNGGTNWTKVLDATGVNGCLDLATRTDTGTDYLFAACGTFVTATIHRNTDAASGSGWTPVYTESGMGRTSLAIAPSNQNIVYALSASIVGGTFQHGLHAIFRSTSSGDPGSWSARLRNTSPTKLNTVLLTNPLYAFLATCFPPGPDQYYNQGWYDNVIAVDPVNADRVWVGGIDLFRSSDGGMNFGLASRWWNRGTSPSSFNHADQHAIVFHPDYNGTTNQGMFVGNDGGLYRTSNAASGVTSTATGPSSFLCGGAAPAGAVAWTELNNNYGVTQFYHGVAYPDGETYFGGTQDNGTVRGSDAVGTENWSMIQGGDGGYVAVNPLNTNILYAEFTGISIQKSTNGGASFVGATSGISDAGLFITPFVMDPSNPERLWTGGQFPWRTDTAAASWTRAGATFGGTSFQVSAIAVANTTSDHVLMGTEAGTIRRTTSATTATSTTVWGSTTPRGGFVSSVAFDPTDESIAYATYSTFGGAHVWKSTNGGVSFTSIDGSGTTGIPDIPVHSIVVDPANTSRLYVGTDLGVFVSRDGGSTWAIENTGFANVVTETLAVGQVGAVPHIFAFTHGRGAFRVPPVDDAGLPTVTIVATDASASESPLDEGTFTISRTGSTAAALVVNYTVAGSAISGADYVALSGTATIAPGASSEDVVLTPVDDSLVEADETAQLTLAPDAAYTIGSPDSATVTVASDDTSANIDLTISALQGPNVGGAGLPVVMKDTTMNAVGGGAAPATTTSIYLSTDPTYDGGDTLLGSRAVPALAAGAKSTASSSLTIPNGVLGRRYIIARADSANVVGESNEGNNTRSRVIYVGPDLTVTKLIGPSSAARGSTVSIDLTTTNIGGATAGASITRVYLSTNKTLDGSDDLLLTRSVPSLAAGSSDSAIGLSVTVPTGTAIGNRFFLAIADAGNAVAESREGANNRRTIPVSITSPPTGPPGLSVLAEFDATTGSPSSNGLVHTGLNIHGATDGGLNFGTVFAIVGRTITSVHKFDGTLGADPQFGLVDGGDGWLYGSANLLFRVKPSGEYEVLGSWRGAVNGRLTRISRGGLVGTAARADSGGGILFQITSSGVFTVLHRFSPPISDPYGGVVVGPDGAFYGFAEADRNLSKHSGIIYRFSMDVGISDVYRLRPFDSAIGQYPDGVRPTGRLLPTTTIFTVLPPTAEGTEMACCLG